MEFQGVARGQERFSGFVLQRGHFQGCSNPAGRQGWRGGGPGEEGTLKEWKEGLACLKAIPSQGGTSALGSGSRVTQLESSECRKEGRLL